MSSPDPPIRFAALVDLRAMLMLGALFCTLAASVQADTREHHPSAGMPTDPELVRRILALDPESISEADVRDTLANAPTPRIILLQGSVPLVTMEPFARFLIAMGYPEASLRDPNDGSYSRSSFESGAELAGELAWYYETEGMMPMLIGHSQGGMVVIRTLHALAGDDGTAIPVRDPLTRTSLPRSTIIDPRDGATRPVVGLKVPYAAALATGKLPRLLLLQWDALPVLRKVPDSAEEFAGFSFEWDPIAGQFPGAEPYAATGTAKVRNITLPADYHHITLPQAQDLATNAVTRAWIDAYVPDTATAALPDDPAVDVQNLLHAADIWHSVKRHWCIEAQRRVRASVTP